MTDDAEFQRRLEGALTRTLDRFCRETVVPRLRQSLDTPYPPASSQGEPPRRRTGMLQQGIDSDVRATMGGAVAFVTSSRAERPMVPVYLEPSRPFMVPEMLRIRNEGLPLIAAIFKEEMGR